MSSYSSSTNVSPTRKRISCVEDLSWMKDIGVSFDDEGIPSLILPSQSIIKNFNEFIKQKSQEEIILKMNSVRPLFVDINKCIHWIKKSKNQNSSLFKILFMIDIIKYEMYKMTTELFELTEYETDTNLIRDITNQIINEISFINFENNSPEYTNFIFSSIKSSHPVAKSLLLKSIFNICSDEEKISDFLLNLVEEEPKMTSEVFFLISETSMSNISKEKFRYQILVTFLASSKSDELPSLITFLLEVCDKKNVKETVSIIRKQLNLMVENLDLEMDCQIFIVEIFKRFLSSTVIGNEFIHEFQEEKIIGIFDFWILFILFFYYRIYQKKLNDLFLSLFNSSQNRHNLQKSIENHGECLLQLQNSLSDFVLYLVSSHKFNLFNHGILLTKILFDEFNSVTFLQDITSSLFISFSNCLFQKEISLFIHDLSHLYPEKMELFVPIIESFIFVNNDLEKEVFTILVKTVIDLSFKDKSDVEKNSSFVINVTKLISMHNENCNEKGIISASLVFVKFFEFSDVYKKFYDDILFLIHENDKMSILFFDILSNQLDICHEMSDFLFSKLQPHILSIYGKSEVNLRDCLIKKNDGIDFSLIVKCSSMLKCYLKAGNLLTKSDIFKLFENKNYNFDKNDIRSIICVHSITVELINCFCLSNKDFCLKLMSNLKNYETEICQFLQNNSIDIDFFGILSNGKNKPKEVISKLRKLDKNVMNLIELCQNDIYMSKRILEIAISSLHDNEIESIPDSLVSFCSENLFAQNNEEKDDLNNLFCNFLCKYLSLQKKDENFTTSLLLLKKGKNVKEIIKNISNIMNLDLNSKINSLKLMSVIVKMSKNDTKEESEVIHSISHEILKNKIEIKKDAEFVFRTFLESSKTVLLDISNFVKTIGKSDVMKSVNEETIIIFTKICYKFIYNRLKATNMKIESQKILTHDEDFLAVLRNRYEKLILLNISLIKILEIYNTKSKKNEIQKRKVIIEMNTKFLDLIASKLDLFSFKEEEKMFVSLNQLIGELNSVVDKVKRSNSKSLDFLPTAIRCLSSISFILKRFQV